MGNMVKINENYLDEILFTHCKYNFASTEFKFLLIFNLTCRIKCFYESKVDEIHSRTCWNHLPFLPNDRVNVVYVYRSLMVIISGSNCQSISTRINVMYKKIDSVPFKKKWKQEFFGTCETTLHLKLFPLSC